MCWKCGAEQDFSQEVYRSSTCASCGADLHSCRGCAFYAPGSHFDCHETVEDLVADKERANFCEHFKAGKNSKWSGVQGQNGGANNGAQEKNAAAVNALFGGANGSKDKDCAEDQKAAVNALFGGASPSVTKSADAARDAFNSLFG